MLQNNLTGITEQHLAFDLLYAQKQLTDSYNSSTGEVSDEDLRQTLVNILDEEHTNEKGIWNAIHQHGWYGTQAADSQDVLRIRTKFSKTRF
ncbi:MAG: spore coat protein [Carboxydocellales bacterium]